MKSIYDIINSCPVKDRITVRFSRLDLPGHIDELTLSEEEFRWLQVAIHDGELNPNHISLRVIDSKGHPHYFDKRGRLSSPLPQSDNCLSLNAELSFRLFEPIKSQA